MAPYLIHHLLRDNAESAPERGALSYRGEEWSYATLSREMDRAARGLLALGLERGARVAVYLEKRLETVTALFAAAAAGGAFVPVNPVLRAAQVGYILRDCNVRVLVTSAARLADLAEELAACPDLRHVILVDAKSERPTVSGVEVLGWEALLGAAGEGNKSGHRVIDVDLAAIMYTSGSTGSPKGVVLSHRNLLAGAESVSSYLENTADDRILSVLPLSFDAGLSQLTTAFCAGAEVTLLNYLLPRDVVRACAQKRITGLTCVPPLWVQLADQEWPADAASHLRYFANTGGHMPQPLLQKLRAHFPQAKPYLMYGLTEAFRSTYLDPAEVDRRPNSMGKAIPNAEILVVRPDGTPCEAGEHGELVHRGALVALGYWNDPDRTAERFRPAPGQDAALPLPEMAVWSGDVVYRDEDDFLYFVGRRDEMIKSSGYRISPTEVEDVFYKSGLVAEAVALGIPHPTLGQGIVVVASPPAAGPLDSEGLLSLCRQQLPRFMWPEVIAEKERLPKGPNGKIDRALLKQEFMATFEKVGHER